MIKLKKTSHDGVLAKIEDSLIEIQDEQVVLLKKKRQLENELAMHKDMVKRLQYEERKAKETLSVWRKVAIAFGGIGGILFSIIFGKKE